MGWTDVTDIGLVEALNACELEHKQEQPGMVWWQKLLALLGTVIAVALVLSGACYLTAWIALHMLLGNW